MSVLIQSGISFKSVKLDINFVIHCFFIVTVGAKIITGFPSLLANSRPNIVFPEPGAATMFIFPSLKNLLDSFNTLSWYGLQGYLNFIVLSNISLSPKLNLKLF